ncbi:MAG: GGDEF domain-containing protein [Desulfobacteraceae bacterium]
MPIAKDPKQQLRLKRVLQAIGGGVIQSMVALIVFVAGGFRLEISGFTMLMVALWTGHITFYFIISAGLNLRFADPAMTREQVIWSNFALLVTLFFMDQFRPLMMMFFPIILIYGAFRMTARQYIATAIYTVTGYFLVIYLLYRLYPNSISLENEIVLAVVFVLIIVAYCLVSNEVSLVRRKLRRRNDDLSTAMEKMERMAITDELTGLLNRRHMLVMLNQQRAIADRSNVGFCICYFDLDNFKNINDTLGHHIGDIVLKRFASAVQSQLRASDLFGRFGGEEFVLLAMGTNLGGAKIAADRIRMVAQAIEFEDVAPALTVTISGGVTQFQHDDTIGALLTRADRAMYLAKNSGKNCIKTESDLRQA